MDSFSRKNSLFESNLYGKKVGWAKKTRSTCYLIDALAYFSTSLTTVLKALTVISATARRNSTSRVKAEEISFRSQEKNWDTWPGIAFKRARLPGMNSSI